MPIYDNVQQTTQTTSAPAGSVSNWTVDDIRKSDILVFRESATEYVDTVVAPNGFQVGLLDEAFLTDLLVTGHITGSGVIYSELGFSGSLQTLTNGQNYLQGSGTVSITNNSDGSITIAGTSDAGSSRLKVMPAIAGTLSAGSTLTVATIEFNDYSYSDSLIDVFLNGDLLLKGTVSEVFTAGTADYVIDTDVSSQGQIRFRFDLTSSDDLVIIGGGSGGGGVGTTYTAGTGLSLASTQFNVDIDNDTITENGSNQLRVIKTPNAVTSGHGINAMSFDGSGAASISVKPVTGSPITVGAAGVGLDITSMSAISLTSSDELLVSQSGTLAKTTVNDIVSLVSAGASAPTNATYLVVSTDSTLSNERVLTAGQGMQISDGGAGGNMTVSALVETNGGMKFVSGKLAVRVADFIGFGLTDNAGNIDVNVSALAGNGLTTSGNQLVLDFSQVAAATNQITVNAGDGLRLGGTATIGNASSTINLEIDTADFGGVGTSTSSNNLNVYLAGAGGIQILTGSGGELIIDGSSGGGSIGSAEDGDYTDGLYTDFTASTPTGTAIDRFNELFKFLMPKSAPSISSIDLDTAAGVTALLSFGSSNNITGVANVNILDDQPAIDVNGSYAPETSSNGHDRAGIYGTAIELVGDIADSVVADLLASGVSNYPAKAFGNANLGTLILEVNGVDAKTIDLANGAIGAGAAGAGTDSQLVSGTGFFELSAATNGKYNSGDVYDLQKHRTGKWKIAASLQRSGWNYMRIKHNVSSTISSSNYIQWVVDPVATNGQINLSTPTLSNLSLTGSKHLSGVEYYTGGSALYAISISNFYTNVYAINAISIDSSDIALVTVTPTSINLAASEDNAKVIVISETVTIDTTSMLNTSLDASFSVLHPTKTTLTNSGAASISSLLVHNIAEAVANTLKTVESMDGESYRLETGTYTTQSSVSSGAFDSTVSLATNSGLQVWNRKLVAPTQSTNSGNYSVITNGPAGNPDYSGLTTGTKTYFRKFTNTKGASSSNFTLEIDGTGTIVDNTTTLTGNNFQIFMKIPGSGTNVTGWMDLSAPFAVGAYSDNNGCYVETFNSSLNSTILFTSGIKFIGNTDNIVIKVVANASWTGHIDELRFTWR
jgi:hypothetical protein